MCCILCVCIYVITLYCIYGMFLIDYGTPVLFKSLFLKLFIKALLSRLLDTSAIEIHYYYYYYIIIIIINVSHHQNNNTCVLHQFVVYLLTSTLFSILYINLL